MSKKERVTEENFESLLLKSVNEASDFINEKITLSSREASLITEPPQYTKKHIKKIRERLGVSQSVFARIFGESTSAVQHWEQGTRNMSKSASRLLNLIEKDPKTVLDLIVQEKAS